MKYTANLNINPREAFELLSVWEERSNTWARAQVAANSTNRIYTTICEPDFQVSHTAGYRSGVVGSGSIIECQGGSTLSVDFNYAARPQSWPTIILSIYVVVALLVLLFSWAYAAVVLLLGVTIWGSKIFETKNILQSISEALKQDLDWERVDV